MCNAILWIDCVRYKKDVDIMSIAVLIPCLNESQTISKVVKDFQTALPNAEIFVYDNNSNDNTSNFAWNAGAIVRFENKQGKGNVVRTIL
jgi:glycosyltransferase involved in cell wall biosynthesis